MILRGDFGILPVEVKLTQTVELRSLRAISDFVRGWKFPAGIIINNDEKIRFYDENIVGIPFSCL